MVDYIPRSEAINELRHRCYPCGEGIEAINAIHAADVAPVVYWRWNADETCPLCGEKSTEGLDAEKWDYWFLNYCPHCGARLDLDGGDSDAGL